MEKIIIPLVVTVVTVILTSAFTIHLKYSSTKEEAYDWLKKLFFYCMLAASLSFQFYHLYFEISSTEPLTRISVFLISGYTCTIFSTLLFLGLSKMILKNSKDNLEIQGRHFTITEKLIDKVSSHTAIQKENKLASAVDNANKAIKPDL